MMYMIHFKVHPGAVQKSVAKFLAKDEPAPKGYKILSRHHAVCGGEGWALVEADAAGLAAIHGDAAHWAATQEISIVPVLADAEAHAALKAAGHK